MAYDEKYSVRVVEFKDSGHTFRELKAIFGIDACTYYRWKILKERTGYYAPKLGEKRTRKRKVDPEKLKAILAEKPDAYLRELAEVFHCSTAAIHKQLKKLGMTFNKRRLSTLKIRKKAGRNTSKR